MGSLFGVRGRHIALWFMAAALSLSLTGALLPNGAFSADDLPTRIVSCGPAITEKLYLLGVEDRVVGVTINCRRPSRVLNKPKIGSVTHVSVEKLISLRPDLVIATSLTDPRVARKVRDLGVKVSVFNSPRSFAEMNEQFIALGRMMGKEREATEIVRISGKRVNQVREETHFLKKKRVFLQIGSSPLFAATEDSFLNDYLVFAGAVNVAANSGIGFYNREQVLKDDPDLILIVAMEGPAAHKEKLAWQKFASLRAVRENAIYVMDPDKMCSPTPVTFVEALEQVVKIVHGDEKQAKE